MLRGILLFLFLILAGLMALAAYIVQAFGWQGLLAVLATAAVFGYVLARFLPRFLLASMTAPLKQLGQVLDGASVKVTAFEPADAPPQFDPEEYEDESSAFQASPANRVKSFCWYTLDVTITPKSSLNAEPENLTMNKWQPDALMVVDSGDANAAPHVLGGLGSMVGGTVGVIAEKLIWDGLDFVPYDGDEVWGIQRMRLHLGLPEGVARIAFLYHVFVRFGDIPVPPVNRIRG